jgi:hypothetical protein
MFFCFLFSCWDLLPFPFWGVCSVVVVVAYCYDYFSAITSCTSWCTLLYTLLTQQSAEHGAVKPQNGMSFPHSVSPSPSVHHPNTRAPRVGTSGGTSVFCSKSCQRIVERDRSRTPVLRGATMYDKPVSQKLPVVKDYGT